MPLLVVPRYPKVITKKIYGKSLRFLLMCTVLSNHIDIYISRSTAGRHDDYIIETSLEPIATSSMSSLFLAMFRMHRSCLWQLVNVLQGASGGAIGMREGHHEQIAVTLHLLGAAGGGGVAMQ